MNKLSSNDIIEGSLFGKTIAEAQELLKVVNQLISEIKETGIVTKNTLDTMEGGTIKNSQQLRTLQTNWYAMTKQEELHTKLLTEQGTLQAKIGNLQEQSTAEIIRQNAILKDQNKALMDEVTGINAKREALAKANEEAKEAAKWAKTAVDIDTRPYEKLRMQLAFVKKEMKDMVVLEKENTKEAQALRMEYEKLNGTIRKAEESVGEYQRSVGNYGKAISGTRSFNYELFQVQQVLRELPNFAISSRIGIMALSNNLPQLGDAFKRLSTAVDETTGKQRGWLGATQLMLKQVFSLQSAFLILISLAVSYSNEIGNFTANLFKANNAIDINKKLQEDLSKIGKQNINNYIQERVEIELLVKVARSETASKIEKENAIKRLNEISPTYLGFITAENVGTVAATNAITKYIGEIEKLARAKAVMDKFTELEKRRLDIEQLAVHSGNRTGVRDILKTNYGEDEGDRIANKIEDYANSMVFNAGVNSKYYNKFYMEGVKAYMDEIIGGINSAESNLLNTTMSSGVLNALGFDKGDKKKGGRDNSESLSDKSRQLGIELAKARVGGLLEGYVKEASKIMTEYDSRKKDAADKYEKLTSPADKANLSALMGELDNQKFAELKSLQNKYSKMADEQWNAEIERRRKGNEDSYKVAIENVRSAEEVSTKEAEIEANALKQKTTNAVERKNIEKDLADEILLIKIKSLEQQIQISEMAAKAGFVSIQQLQAMQAELKRLKSEIGIDPTDKAVNPQTQRQRMKAMIDGFSQIFEAREKSQQNRLDKQIAATKQRQQQLRDLANLGQRDAQQSVAYEERKQAELERKKEQIQKRAARRQIATTALQAASNRLNNNDPNAISNTISDVSRLLAAIYSFPTYYEGIEDVSKANALHDFGTSKDPFLVRVHPKERIMTANQNELVGDMSNEDLAQLALRYRTGMMHVPIPYAISDDKPSNLLLKKMDEVKQAIESQPMITNMWNDQEKAMQEIIRAGNKTTVRIHKGGGVWRN